MRTRSTDRRRWPSILTLALAGAGLTQAPSPARANPEAPAAKTRVEAIQVTNGGRKVLIRTSAAPEFSVFEMTSPRRLLVDIRGAELDSGLGDVVGRGLVAGVRPSRFVAGAEPVARVEIELAEDVTHRARATGRSVVVELSRGKAARVGRLRAQRDGKRTLLRAPLGGAPLSSDGVHLETLASPSRLVVDLDSVTLQPKWQRIRVGRHGIRRARAGARDDGARVVLDLEPGADFPQVAVDVVGRELQIVITDAPAPTAASEPAPPAPAAEPAPTAAPVTLTAAAAEAPAAPAPSRPAAPKRRAAEPTPSAAPPEALHRVENVRFEPKDGFYRLTVQLAGPASSLAVSRAGTEASPELRLSGAALPSALERTMDVTAVAGDALNSVSTYMDGSDLVVAASILDATEHRHWRKGQRLMWDFRSAKPRVLDYEQESAASFSSEAARTAGRLAPGRQRYTGRRISLDLKDADIQNVLRLLADVSKLNIVAADDVTGRITIKLRNVPWDQALDIILRAKQLDKTRNGNIIRVAPLSVLRKEEELRLARLQAQVQLEPLTVRLIPVSYAVASDVAPQVKALLTNRGDVNIDKRTNVLIVEDIADVLTKVERLVRTLDTQTPQVLIEARIVEARSNFSRELGIQWGGNASFTQNFGNQTGLSFPSNIRIAGGADDAQNQVTEGVLPNANYAVNLPAAVGAGGGGALGFVFGSLNGGTLVNLRLSAAETTGKVKIVSAPKVVTLDNKEAKILSGERVPITVITANGPTTRFIDANIELKVLPHVTQDGSILMQIKAKKNELSDRIDFLGVPGVLTKEAETQMIVRDGDTAVLGGLYRRTSQENESYVPWIGKIPVLGWLFKTTSRNDARDETLIFISPRIVNRSAALIAPE